MIDFYQVLPLEFPPDKKGKWEYWNHLMFAFISIVWQCLTFTSLTESF